MILPYFSFLFSNRYFNLMINSQINFSRDALQWKYIALFCVPLQTQCIIANWGEKFKEHFFLTLLSILLTSKDNLSGEYHISIIQSFSELKRLMCYFKVQLCFTEIVVMDCFKVSMRYFLCTLWKYKSYEFAFCLTTNKDILVSLHQV